jgi:hypothetical protein
MRASSCKENAADFAVFQRFSGDHRRRLQHTGNFCHGEARAPALPALRIGGRPRWTPAPFRPMKMTWLT